MKQGCDFKGQCAFMKECAEPQRSGFARLFCSSAEGSKACARKYYKMNNGEEPPKTLAPTGYRFE